MTPTLHPEAISNLLSAMDAIDRVLSGANPAVCGTLTDALAYITPPTRIDAVLAEPTPVYGPADLILDERTEG